MIYHCFAMDKKRQVSSETCRFWQGWRDSNSRMTESKSVALPLGYIPILKTPNINRSLRFGLVKMGWMIGIEPTTSRATTWHSNQLSYIHHILARMEGLEPPTYCLEGSCSIQLSYIRALWSG